MKIAINEILKILFYIFEILRSKISLSEIFVVKIFDSFIILVTNDTVETP